jgi:plastocyanin
MRGRITHLGIVLGIIFAVAPAVPAAAGGGCHATGTTTARTNAVIMSELCYSPTLTRVPVGATVTWVNKDPVKHTVTGANLAFGNFEELGNGQTLKARFDEPGVYAYYCVLHAAMAGAVIVGEGAELLAAVNRVDGGARNVSGTVQDAAQKVAATRPEPAGSSWPAVATLIGLGSVGVGFGAGRLMRKGAGSSHQTWEPSES